MADRNHAWITYVHYNADVQGALVLAKSLRESRTVYRIVALVSNKILKKNTEKMELVFDDLFQVNTSLVSEENFGHMSGIIFAWSLTVYGTSVYLDPYTFALENCDQVLKSFSTGLKDLSGGSWTAFQFVPDIELFKYLRRNYLTNNWNKGGIVALIAAMVEHWINNNERVEPSHSETMTNINMLQFSIDTECLKIIGDSTSLGISFGQFVDISKNTGLQLDQLLEIHNKPTLKLTEKALISRWLRILKNDYVPEKSTQRRIGFGYRKEPVAIVGMSCRYPGANNVAEFWNILEAGIEAIDRPPSFRWTKEQSIYGHGKKQSTEAGFLRSPVDQFDAKFFGLSPMEAELLDPQARLLHEVMWESLENSGIDPVSLHGTHTGVFTGSWMNNYKDISDTVIDKDFFRTYMGNSMGATAARLSFLLGLTGPSIATESGCSSAIVALHLAVKSLQNGETDLGICAGVNLLLHPFSSSIMEHFLSPNGRCKTFDAKADGFGRAEGCGVLVLKRLSDALRDRDYIWAQIRGSAITQEGTSRSLGTPTVRSEALSMELALRDACVYPEEVTFVETHGTGTSVGDPMEVAAIAKAYCSSRRKNPLILGSVKTNVGHTESCSGITGIMKTILAMQNELIPKHLNLETVNPQLNLEAIPARIPIEPIPWPRLEGIPRLAGVSSFGITGTDGHVVLEEAPDYLLPKFTIGMERPLHIFKISAKSPEALEQLLFKYRQIFESKAERNNFANAAYTANLGRASFRERSFILGKNYNGALKALDSKNVPRSKILDEDKNHRKICFLFTGQGCQYPGMSQSLYETSPVFRLYFDQCERLVRLKYGISIGKVLWQPEIANPEILCQTIYSQTSIFVVEYCLLQLWESWGIKPDYVLGHSLGEFCAAVAARFITLEDALTLVVERSRLINSLTQGTMLVIEASHKVINEMMLDSNISLDLAAVNTTEQTVVAGDTEMINRFQEICKSSGIKATVLRATHAFHSSHMNPILSEYRKICNSIKCKKGSKCMYISSVNGKVIQNPSEEINANYWAQHTRSHVSFLEACKTLHTLNCKLYLEIGPQPVLSSFVMQNINDSLCCLPSLRRQLDDWETMLTSLGKLYLKGFPIDWAGYDRPYARQKVSFLPNHPLKGKPYWVKCQQADPKIVHPLIGHTFYSAVSQNIFQNVISLKSIMYLQDHCIAEIVVFPGACFAEMCLAAGFCSSHSLFENMEKPFRAMAVENVRIETPLEIKLNTTRLQTIVDFKEREQNIGSNFICQVFHQNVDESEDGGCKKTWILHASAIFHPFVDTKSLMKKWSTVSSQIRIIMDKHVANSTEQFYKSVDCAGLKFGESFRGIVRCWHDSMEHMGMNQVIAEIRCPNQHEQYLLHPLVIDAMMQTFILSKWKNVSLGEKGYNLQVPVRLGKLTLINSINATENENLLAFTNWNSDTSSLTVFLCSKTLTLLAVMEDLELLETNVKTIQSVLRQQKRPIPDSWKEIWKPVWGPNDRMVDLGAIKANQALTNESFKSELVIIDSQIPSDEETTLMKINRLLHLYTLKALLQLGWNPQEGKSISVESISKICKILPKFSQLVRYYLVAIEQENYLLKIQKTNSSDGVITWNVIEVNPSISSVLEKEICSVFLELQAEKRLYVLLGIYKNVGMHLHEYLSGKTSVLPVLFPPEGEVDFAERQKLSAQAYYDSCLGRETTIAKAKTSLRHIFNNFTQNGIVVAENSRDSAPAVLRVLEVGAGTGALTAVVIPLLLEMFGENFSYWFTDISAYFFSKAEAKFQSVKHLFRFSTFNIEESPNDQGIPVNHFDLVLASDVLHATKNLMETLTNLRQALRPHANIFFAETISATKYKGLTFVFGLLEGYWAFQDYDTRPYHCCVDEQTWTGLCLESGFECVVTVNAYMSVLGFVTATATKATGFEVPTILPLTMRKKWVVFAPEKGMETVLNAMHVTGYAVNVIKPPDCLYTEDTVTNFINSTIGEAYGVIYAWALNENFTEQSKIALPFMILSKSLLNMSRPPRVYVLTRSVQALNEIPPGNCNPSGATLFGICKSLKNESWDLFIRIVDLELKNENTMTEANQLLFEMSMHKEGKEKDRIFVVYRSNVRYEPKLLKGNLAQNALREELEIPSFTERYQLVLPKSRMIHDLCFDVLTEETLENGEVEVAVKAYALNFRDILTILKPVEEFENYHNIGLDFAGVVTKVGRNVTNSGIQLGDRVFGVKTRQNPLPSHAVLDSSSILKIPDGISFTEAATIPAVFATSFYCLLYTAKLKMGETVLIHTASGGVGLMAIQVAKLVGANIIATAGSSRKRAYLRGIGVQHVFHSRNTSYKHNILHITGGKGVDVVLNSITGPGFKEATLEACAQNARFVEMSRLSIWTDKEVKQMRPDVVYTLVDLTKLTNSDWRGLSQHMKTYLDEDHVTFIPYVQFDALRIRQALQYFQKAKHIGKVVVTMPALQVECGNWSLNVNLFYPQASYLITGGMGGIGLEVCKWMLRRGATNIILLGRTPPKQEVATEICRLNRLGYNVITKLANVGDELQMRQVFAEVAKDNKPLRGIHHCAGVLLDSMLANHSWTKFEATFVPKVQGTWNLHNLSLGIPLEHFVMYSSMTALAGTPSQANHSAANSFEDAFAHYRHAIGLPATTVNWGQWSQVGVAREINLSGVLPVSVVRMFNALDEIFRNQTLQVAVGEFENFKVWASVCPTFKQYLDERLWNAELADPNYSCILLKTESFWKEMDYKENRDEKMEVVVTYMKEILRGALRMDAEEPIGNDVNIKDLGVDSLMLIEIKNSIQTLMGSRLKVTANMLKDCVTIRDLATAIVSKLYHDSEDTDTTHSKPLSSEELEDLIQRDICLEENIQCPGETAKKITEIQRILITGATGQMGPYMLACIFEVFSAVTKIVCLIRTKNGQCPTEKLKTRLKDLDLLSKVDFSKVTCISGNIVLSYFGLEKSNYDKLAAEVDAVIHLAAKINHVECYKNFENNLHGNDVRSTNVGGTLNVLRFASTFKTKCIFYASTILCVFGGKVDDRELCDRWPVSEEIRVILSNYKSIMGYAISKYVCEMLIKQAVERGICCKVFRFPWVLGETRSGQIDALHSHYILRFLSYLKLKAMPIMPLPAVVLPVDICADLSMKIFFNDETPNEIYNIAHPNPQLEKDFVKIAEEDFGVTLELEEWETQEQMEKLYGTGMPLEMFQEMYIGLNGMYFFQNSVDLRMIHSYFANPESFFKNTKVEKFIPNFGRNIPTTMDTLKMNLYYAKKNMIFQKFGI